MAVVTTSWSLVPSSRSHEIPVAVTLKIYREVSSYKHGKKAVKNFDNGMSAYNAVSTGAGKSVGKRLEN